MRRLTRANFYETGEWAGAYECWELAAPIPELRIRRGICRHRRRGHDFIRARLGDRLIRTRWGVVVL